MEIGILGIDLARQVFKLYGADPRGLVLHRAKVSRGSLFESVRIAYRPDSTHTRVLR